MLDRDWNRDGYEVNTSLSICLSIIHNIHCKTEIVVVYIIYSVHGELLHQKEVRPENKHVFGSLFEDLFYVFVGKFQIFLSGRLYE